MKILLLLSLFSFGVLANSNFGNKNVTKIIIHDSGNVYVYFSGDTIHTEQCDEKITYVLPKENILFKEMYSGLLASMHSGAKVSGWVNGCYNVWGKTKPKITRLDFTPN
ncbi:hypothetical protein [Vibrio nigripulchritudo]|uniref:hypothetical protein n=1 Tax=Vibrio nigripulchritudo TaxID=28173 RepID=UPI00249036E0|nr:hypothetical protein [Vibrio nigripulchritudo]BDU39762.1 hypothetical protein TUMSATVNIG2_42310 [Vibrio nigripulchritudo]BDU45485.1 hypothetical protein TUMSATVNIG3_42830 [Vibrio nigripulchritudo]